MFMRMQENFSGGRVLAYCIISNHFHILLEVPPMPQGGIADEHLLKRLSATNSEAFMAARDRFTERRKDGARRMKASGKAAAGMLWSARDLRVRLG